MQKACAQCGDDFEARRSTAKYCGDRCRQQARRKSKPDDETAARLPRIVELTEKELKRLEKLETVTGQQAVTLATRMCSMKDTASSIAAASRELDRLMLRLTSGAATAEDQLASARRRRDEKRRQAAEAREA